MRNLFRLKVDHLLWAGVISLLAGCATHKPIPKNYVVFPPPPDEARIQYLTSFGSESDLGGQSKFNQFIMGEQKILRPITKPYGVTMRGGKIYVCDTQAANVCIVDVNKRTLRPFKPIGQAALKMPINVAADDDGTFYVTDSGRKQVLIYNKEGELLEALGKKGEMEPCGIALAGDRLYVSDLANHCVRVYEKATRKLLFSAPRDRADAKAIPFGPTNIAIDQKGQIYVSDSRGFAVKIYDAEGNFVRSVGDLGVTPGQFTLNKGIGVDREGRFYVVDAAAPVVQLFDDQGRLLMWFGEPKSSGPAGLYLPAGLTVDYESVGLFQKYAAPGYKLEYLILLTNQVGPQKVSIFGFLKKG
jgi:DNA-binding beta-propeller fold protein YncE